MKVSLCLLVRNELAGCKVDVPRLPRDAFDEIYAVDGGSSDGTDEYLQSQGIPVHRQPKKGLNAAYIHANAVSQGDAVVVFFPKGTLPVEDVLKFRPLFEEGYELVIASRQIEGSSNEEDSKLLRPRKWAVRCLATLASLVWRRDGHRVLVPDCSHDLRHRTSGDSLPPAPGDRRRRDGIDHSCHLLPER